MKSLIIAEQNGGQLSPMSANLVAVATKIGGEIDLLVVGASGVAAAAEQARSYPGVTRVLTSEAAEYAHFTAENVAPLIVQLAGRGYTHVLAIASAAGKNLLPRVAALLDVGMVSEITEVVECENRDTFVRPIYAGSLLAKVRCAERVRVLSVRATAFPAVEAGGNAAPVEAVAATGDRGKARVVGQQLVQSARPELTAARIIVSGGRAMGSKENFHQTLEPLADILGAGIGGSRAAVDSGYVSNELQVGQTGKIVAPQLYVAVGISGAIQHLAGMKDSKVIVAINKDEEAPIFQVADYGLVGDLFQLVPELTQALAAARS
ncbi:electron transfer flavoprotein subunit alpha/FixB family protein [Aromatoleum diolicum]|uniref:Electron transfer flavoprotein subunit alpha/FixB family protein n=1 Tax=Aromatoleum diolicum TaxID=75796 RepID=A0ABX1Q8K3_9RHOO|nr:FAD-binding protein [Aromatoleum diolicum]NMG74692.1 electron transfer flavoprotein subunit alpha/FixB family protein [Aromatoleum diolicum]